MSNRLATQASLYLQQHAANPVDWWPWSAEALALARAEDRPILLSIGYSACHWCHVMAHESFEDAEIAARMNRLFVNIKIDREERPDLDKVYQLTHQLMNRQGGGWPLTVFLDPQNLAPYFSGTYFPPEPRHGLPGFGALLEKLEQAFRAQRQDISQQRAHLDQVFRQLTPPPAALPDAGLLATTVQQIQGDYDELHGGWSGAPKFPHPVTCEFLLAQAGAAGRQQVRQTLSQMAAGGLFDQLGGGFFRYSVDARWEIPHFEKMLYDNGQLLKVYALTYAEFRDPRMLATIERTIAWLEREMADQSGLFSATLDADSEGEEGRFYAWDHAELEAVAGADWALLRDAHGLAGTPNFEGRWHLRAPSPDMDNQQAERLRACHSRLFAAREQRVRPGRDHKLISGWNALLAEGLFAAALACDRPAWGELGSQILKALHTQHWRDGRLAAVSQTGTVGGPGYLDDYAFSLQAIVLGLQWRWDSQLLQWGCAMADAMLEIFAGDGALYFSAADPDLIHRPVPFIDEALPSGNGIAAQALLALGDLLGEPRYLQAAEGILQAASTALTRYPTSHLSLLLALANLQQAQPTVILRADAAETNAWRAQLPAPARMYCIPADSPGLPAGLAGKTAAAGPLAYLCYRGRCLAPVDEPRALVFEARD